MAVLKLALILLHTHNLYEWSRWKYKTVEIGRERVHGMTTTDEPYYSKTRLRSKVFSLERLLTWT